MAPDLRCVGRMMRTSWLSVSAAILFAGCFSVGGPRDPNDDGSDRQADDLDSVPQQPSADVCSGGTYHCYAKVRTDETGVVKTFATTPSGLGPADLKSAYKLDTSKTGGTIAIVDAYNYPNAESDLAAYRSQYGLPACTKANGCFSVVNQNGAASPLPANAPAKDDWTVEAALDLDLASAACPNCKIVLVLADDDQGTGLYVANKGAASIAGVKVISNSWGGAEGSNDPATYDTYLNHTGISTFVASGDSGYTGTSSDYPSTSKYVTAVGGTTLTKSTTAARGWTEGAWSDAGSSCGKSTPKPAWQANIATTTCKNRAAADVSAVADPNTGLAVYNKANGGWIVVGGTSAASPFVAGVYALYGLGGQDGSYAYAHPANFFDVTTGKNGTCTTPLCKASAGWDGPTGLGTPNGAAIGGTATGGGGTCTPTCGGKTCGDDGCGGTCGTCATGSTCTAGTCIASGGTGGSTCSHSICSTGDDLQGCTDSCAVKVCNKDSFCCTNSWDATCVDEVTSVCGQSCSGGGTGGGSGSTCSHNECNTGTKLKSGCDSCVTKICAADSYCCGTKWDAQCQSEVSSICNETCN